LESTISRSRVTSVRTSAGRAFGYNAKNQVVSATPAGGAPIPMSYTGTGQFRRVSRGSSSFTDSTLGLTREDTTSYTRDNNGLLLAMRADADNYYYLPDGLGSIAAVTDSAGNLAASYSYEPFGTLKSSTGTLSNPYRWLGALGVYFDTATGLYKMGTRYYDPALGRFTQVDPIDGGSANRYDYAAQDPLNLIDSDGMAPGDPRGIGPVTGILFLRAGIPTTRYFQLRLIQRVAQGRLTERAAVRAYRSGRLFFDPKSTNFIRHDSRSRVSVVVTKPTNGKAINVFEGAPSPRWIHVRYRRARG